MLISIVSRLTLLIVGVLLLVAGPARANSYPQLPLANASFERPAFGGWSTTGQLQTATLTTPGVAREGTGYGAVSSATGSGDSFFQRLVTPVAANRSYTFALWAKSATGAPVDVMLDVIGEGQGVQIDSGSFTVGGSWQLISATLDSTLANDDLLLSVWVKTANVQLLVDGAQLIDDGLSNASWERQDFVSWSHDLSAATSAGTPNAHDGDSVGVVRSPGQGHSFFQDNAAAVSAGTSYAFSLWVRSQTGEPVRGSLALTALGGSPETTSTPYTAGPAWSLVTATLSPLAGDHTALRTQVYVDTPGLDLWVDGAQLSTTGLVNAGFEQGFFRGWTSFWRGPLVSAMSANAAGVARDGAAYGSVVTDTPARSFSQDIAVAAAPGDSHAFSVWLRSPTGARGSVVLSGVGGNGEYGQTPFYVGPTWTLISAPLSSTSNHSALRAEVLLDTPGAELQIDAASMAAGNARDDEPVPGPPAPAPPPPPPAPDTDRDGVPDASDLCKKLAGTAARRGCPRGLTNHTSIAYRRSGKGIRVVRYYVEATKGARITVSCSKHACRKTVTKGKGAKRVRITRLSHRRLKSGASITVTVSMKNRLSTKVIDRVRNGRRVAGRRHCYQPGTSKPALSC